MQFGRAPIQFLAGYGESANSDPFERQIMNVPSPKLIMIGAVALGLAACPAAQAGSTFYFNANQAYSSAADSPFSGSGLHLENFEDGALNLAGVTANHGHVQGPGSNTDSVDGDDGSMNNLGRDGHSFSSGSSKSITFKFSNSGGQGLPTMAGLVWTDGHHDSTIRFRAWDNAGKLIGKIKVSVGDLVRNGTTAEDRFLGLVSSKGISKIRISSNYAGFEIDHLQFAYGSSGMAVVPLPPAAAMGLLGLVGVGLLRRRFTKLLAH